MKQIIKIKHIGTIADIQDREELTLIMNDWEVEELKKYYGNNEEIDQFDGFFADLSDGEYSDLMGYHGQIPDLNKSLYSITIEY